MGSRQPNILFVMTDQLRADCVGYVNEKIITPNLNELSKNAITFTNAYTTNPSCIPARAAIFTGRYPSRCGAPTYITALPENETTFMKLLQSNGYYTAVIGKQHFWTSTIDRGYDYEDIVDEHCPTKEFDPKQSSYIQFLVDSGFKNAQELFSKGGRTFDTHWIQSEKYHVDEYIGNRGLEWLAAKCPDNCPWFLTLSFPGPHAPYDGLGLLEEALYQRNEIELPKTFAEDILTKPRYYRDLQQHFCDYEEGVFTNKLSDDELRKVRHAYYANISLIDRKIGEVVKLLKEKGLYDDTLIIFVSDHGDYMGDFGMVAKGQYLSEALTRIPLLIKPAVKSYTGRQEPSFVSSAEIAASCLDAAGLPIPDNIEERSLLGFVDETAVRQESIYCEARDIRSIRTRDFKLIHYANREYGELYDMQSDPFERHNLWNASDYGEVKASLTRLLLDKLIAQSENGFTAWNVDAPPI